MLRRKTQRNFFTPRLEPLEDRCLLAVTINAGDHVLLPDTPDQEIEIYASGGDAVNGVALFIQIADGGPEVDMLIDGPEITGGDILTGTIFAANNTGQAGAVLVPQIAQYGTTTGSGTVEAEGLLATITIDTTGFTAANSNNPWALMLTSTLAGDSGFPDVSTIVINGTISIVSNQNPTDIALSDSSVDENQPAGTLVGALSTSDPDGDDTFTYSLVAGEGDTDNALFTIADAQLQTNAVFDYETQSSYSVRVRSTDDGGLSFEKALTVNVADINDTPMADAGGPYTVAEGGAVTLSASASTDDDLPGDTLSYAWDFDGDGQYDDATGIAPVFSAAALDGTNPPTVVEIGLKVTDGSDASDYAQSEVTVSNVAPAVAILGAPASVQSGIEINLTSNVTDPAPADTHTYQWNVDKDGNPFASAADPALDFTPDGAGTFTVTLTVTDDDGDFAVDTRTILVTNTPPVADAGGPYTVDEGATILLDASGSYDPDGDDGALLYAWDFDGDGEYDDATGIAPVFSAAALDGTNPPTVVEIGLKVTDGSDGSDYAQADVSVSNVAPSLAILGAPASVRSGIEINLTSHVTDPAPADTHTYQWNVDKDGNPFASAADPALDFTPDGAGTFTVTLTVTDDDGDFAADMKTILVTNTGPVADAGGPYTVDEGAAITLDASASYDPDGDDGALLYAWDFDGDGEYDDATGIAPSFSAATLDGTSPATSIEIGLEVTDGSGASNYDTTSVGVSNVAPNATILDAPATSPKAVQISLTSLVSDPGVADTLTYSWTVTRDGNPFAAGAAQNLDFLPTLAGSYVVTLTVSDDDGGEGTDSKTILVENATPVANAGGPYAVNEGAAVSLDASATTDEDLPNETLVYAWDFDGDGEYDDATGVAPIFSAAGLDGTSPPTTVEVALKVTDDSGASAYATAAIGVINVAPTAAIVGAPLTSPVAAPISLASNVSDPGLPDTHSYLWEVADGASVVATGTEADFSFTPTRHADYVVNLTVTDDDLGTTEDTKTIRALTDLGEVDFRVEQVNPGAGDRYYSLHTAHRGYLTLEVVQADPNDTLSFALLDDSLNELHAVPNVGVEHRLDWQVAAGEAYSVALVGSSNDVTLRIANLLDHTGTDVTVYGTSSDDTFDFNAQNSRDITINGVLYPFEDAEIRTVQFDAGAGTDVVTLQGSDYSESLLVGPQGEAAVETAVFEVTEQAAADPFTVTATGFEQLLAWSRTGGHDVATFHDSVGSDKLKAHGNGEYVILRSIDDYQGFYRRAKKFDEVNVIADVAPEGDRAVLIDSAGDDQFTGDASQHSYELSGPGYAYRADLFKDVLVRSDYGGTDSAQFVDSPVNDKFRGTSVKAWLFSVVDPFNTVVRRFDTVGVAFPNGGYDKVRLFDSGNNDQFTARHDGSTFQMPAVTFTETEAEYVLAYSEIREGETDSAALHKAGLADLHEDLSDMMRLTYDGVDRIIECMGFEQMDVFEPPLIAAATYEQSVDLLMQKGSWDE